jgi:hypothetical protein
MTIDDFMIPLRMTLALPDEYEYERKRALDHPEELSLEELCGRLITEEAVQRRSRGERRPGAANPATGERGVRRGERRREGTKDRSAGEGPSSLKCFRCSGPHLARECPEADDTPRKCHKCGSTGHLQKACPERSQEGTSKGGKA